MLLLKSASSGCPNSAADMVRAKRGCTPKSYGGYSSEGFNRPSPSLIIGETSSSYSAMEPC